MKSAVGRARLGLGLVLGVGCGFAGCGPAGGGTAGEGTTNPSSVLERSGLSERRGQVLELTVPLLGGGRLELAELRGRAVLLDLGDASNPARDEAQARYRALVERDERVVVVSVALDATAEDLPASWQDAPPFVLGWDPQGALAARLQLVMLPTVVLLDTQGRIVSVHEGATPDDAALGAWLGTGNGTEGACVGAAP
ncbi:MAG: hypothetical protein AB1Z98_04455 [Nannocystaceae bacterium]